MGNLLHLGALAVLTWCHHVDVGRMRHASTGGENLVAVVGESHASVVSPVVGDLLHLALQVGLVEVQGSMPYTDEGEALGVFVPCEALDVGVELLGHVVFLTCGEVIYAETVAVALISITSHALPCDVLAVGRELRIGVVTRIVLQILRRIHSLVSHALGSVNLRLHVASLLAEVLGLARTYII